MANFLINNADFFGPKLTPMYKQVEVRRWLEKFSEFLNEKYETHGLALPITFAVIDEYFKILLDESEEKEI